MKLFITNKYDMEDEVKEFQIDPKVVHSIAYHELLKSIDIDECIPLKLAVKFNEDDIVLLNFVTTKNDIYYFNFKGVL